MFLDRLQASRACAVGCLAAASLVGSMPSQAQPAPAGAASAPAAEMTPTERAQRDADKVFKWILIHSDKPRKAGANRAEEKRDEKPVAAVRAKPAARVAEAAPAATQLAVAPSPVAAAVAAPVADPSPAPVADPSTAPVDIPPAPLPRVETRAVPSSSPPPAAVAAEALDETLTPLFRADPQFPPNLLRTLRKGQVQVRFMVQPDGSVAEPTVVTTSNAKLNASALAAVAQWRFAPLHKPQPGVVALGFDLD